MPEGGRSHVRGRRDRRRSAGRSPIDADPAPTIEEGADQPVFRPARSSRSPSDVVMLRAAVARSCPFASAARWTSSATMLASLPWRSFGLPQPQFRHMAILQVSRVANFASTLGGNGHAPHRAVTPHASGEALRRRCIARCDSAQPPRGHGRRWVRLGMLGEPGAADGHGACALDARCAQARPARGQRASKGAEPMLGP